MQDLKHSSWQKILLDDGHDLSLYTCFPEKDLQGVVIVLHEIFGITSFIKDVCQYWANLGYLAVTPAMYDRLQKDLVIPYTGNGIDQALMYREKLSHIQNNRGLSDWDLQLYDIRNTLNFVRENYHSKIAITDFCWGGTLCWLSASRLNDISCVSAYYGIHIYQFIEEKPQCPLMLHAGNFDEHLTIEQVDVIAHKYPKVDIYRYNAGHAFCCPEWPAYDMTSCQQADKRTKQFFISHL